MWNKIVCWPTNLPKLKKQKMFKCRHCKRRFITRQGLGGHTSKMHPGASTGYQRKLIRRAERESDRAVHRIAKELYAGLKQGTLDHRTNTTFKWLRNRMTAYEKAQAQLPAGEAASGAGLITTEKIKQSEKDRVRRIKNKVWRVLEKPQAERKKLLGGKWLARFDLIKPS